VDRLSSARSSHHDDDDDDDDDLLSYSSTSSLSSSLPLARADRGPMKQNMQWQNRFKELCLFKEKYGHCSVPYNYQENRRLAQVRVFI
jgi:hypothetical protein